MESPLAGWAQPDNQQFNHSPPSSEKRARLSCASCRKRKVKCDRKEPVCTACEKHQEQCAYPLERKRVVRRSAYKDMAQRLAKMERLISDFAINPNSNDDESSPAISDGSQVEGLNIVDKLLKRELPSPIEESDFSWAIPETEKKSIRTSTDTQGIDLLHDQDDSCYKGPCSIFSPKGIEWVNFLVGDNSFSQMISAFSPTRKTRELEFDTTNRHPLPPHSFLLSCINAYCHRINNDIRLFQEDVIRDGLEVYRDGNTNPKVGWYASVNIILAHAIRNEPDLQHLRKESDKYMYNALSVIPTIILAPPDTLSIGALLSIVLYFMFTFENGIAMSILGIAIQQMDVGRYQHDWKLSSGKEAENQQRRRLFWNGFILDTDISLRLGKPPVFNECQVIELPEERPADGLGIMVVAGVSFHFLRVHVALAKIQSKAYFKLHSDRSVVEKSPEKLYATIAELDEDLQKWKENVPEVLRPQNPLDQFSEESLIFLTVLHYSYFQLIIAIHSVVFHGFAAHNADDRDERIIGSVALCVGAARASIALLNYHDNNHPFTQYLVNHVAWSVDILFMNILQNKSSPKIVKDLKLLERVVEFYIKHDPDREKSPTYHVTKAMYIVASKAVDKAQGLGAIPIPSVNRRFQSLGIDDNFVEFPSNFSSYTAPLNVAYDDTSFNNGLNSMFYLESEWMMPLGFQPQYWQDPWANVFQDPEFPDISLH